MEDPKAAENTATQVTNPPPETTQKLHSQPLQAPVRVQAPATHSSKKRLLDNVKIQDSSYYKMRLVLKDLRPHFIEVLRTSDFRNCKASHDIREKIRTLMELYKQMTAETVSVKKFVTEGQPPQDGIISKPSENKSFQFDIVSKQQPVDGDGSCIIGGSAFGWNFITFSGSQPVYYGVTKESFRHSQVNLEGQ